MRKTEMFLGMVMLTLTFPMTAFASDGFEDFNDYMTEDGNYAYYFECGINVTVHTPLSREVFWHEYAKIPRHTSQNSIAAGNLE